MNRGAELHYIWTVVKYIQFCLLTSTKSRSMKDLQIAVILVLCISFGKALRCNCVYKINGQNYINTKQNCHDEDSVCVSVDGKIPAFGKYIDYKRCMKSPHANGLKNIGWLRVNICQTDFCN